MGLSFQFVVTQFLSAVLVEEAATTPAPGRRLEFDAADPDHFLRTELDAAAAGLTPIVGSKCSIGIVDLMVGSRSDDDFVRKYDGVVGLARGNDGGDQLRSKLEGKLDQCIQQLPECREREKQLKPFFGDWKFRYVVAEKEFEFYHECIDAVQIEGSKITAGQCLEEYIKFRMNKDCPDNSIPGDQGHKCTEHDSCASEFYCSENTKHPQTCQPKKERRRKCHGDQRKCQDDLICKTASGGVESKCWRRSD